MRAIGDILTVDEYEFSQKARDALRSSSWANELVNRTTDTDGELLKQERSGLFELRFAYGLILKGIDKVQYEYPTVGETSVDFRFSTDREWLVELVSIGTSNAVLAATGPNEDFPFVTEMTLSSRKSDFERHKWLEAGLSIEEIEKLASELDKQSEEGELLLLQQKIGEKVQRKGKPIKFLPVTESNAIHVIVVDARAFMGGGGTWVDFSEACVGPAAYNNLEHKLYRFWNGAPIKGIFELDNTKSGAPLIRERIHLIHFVVEERDDYTAGGIDKATQFLYPNPWIFPSEDQRRETHKAYPFQRIDQ